MRVTHLNEDSSASEPARHYDAVAGAWSYLLGEDLHYGYFRKGDETLAVATGALTGEMLSLAAPRAAIDVLDIGCGAGKAACDIASASCGRVTGISTSRACVSAANLAAAECELDDRVRFFVGDGMALSFADASFDLVWVLESSHLMNDKGLLLSECNRVLRPGGRLVLCDIMLDHKLSLEQVIDYRDQFLLLRDVFGRARMETPEFYLDSMCKLGLLVEHQRNITAQTRPTFACWRRNAGSNEEIVSPLLGNPALLQFLESCEILEEFWDGGILGYGMLSASKPQ